MWLVLASFSDLSAFDSSGSQSLHSPLALSLAIDFQVHMDISELKAPSNAKPDLDADARKELERVEATVKRTPIPVHKASD